MSTTNAVPTAEVMRIVDGTPPPNFPAQVIIMDREFAKRHPDKGFYLRVQSGTDVQTVDLLGEATLPRAVSACRSKGYQPTHWMEVGGGLSPLPFSIVGAPR